MKNYLISEAIGDIAGSAYNRYVWGQSLNIIKENKSCSC